MDFYKNYWEFDKFFRQLFENNSTMSLSQLNSAYERLTLKYPDYYTKTWNNQNFLFLKDFDYSSGFLNFFSKKIELNFLEGNRSKSPLMFSLQEAIHYRHNARREGVSDKNKKEMLMLNKAIEEDSGNLFFIFKTDSDKIINFKIDILNSAFKNYHNFFEYPLSRASYKDENDYNRSENKPPPLHILGQIIEKISSELLSSYSKIKKDDIDWDRTRQEVWNNIFLIDKFKKEDFYYSFNSSVNNQLTPILNYLLLIIRLGWSEKIDATLKKKLYNDLKTYCGQTQIDWAHKIDNEPLAYKIMNALFNPGFFKDGQAQEYYDFTRHILFDEILSSGFSFHSVFSTHHKVSSYYEMLEENWLKNYEHSTSGTVEQRKAIIRLMKEVLSEGPAFEEKIKLEKEILNSANLSSMNIKIKI